MTITVPTITQPKARQPAEFADFPCEECGHMTLIHTDNPLGRHVCDTCGAVVWQCSCRNCGCPEARLCMCQCPDHGRG